MEGEGEGESEDWGLGGDVVLTHIWAKSGEDRGVSLLQTGKASFGSLLHICAFASLCLFVFVFIYSFV